MEECEYYQYVLIGVSISIIIIDEVLPFVPEKYIKANGIIQLLLIIGKKILKYRSNTNIATIGTIGEVASINTGDVNIGNMNVNNMNVRNINV